MKKNLYDVEEERCRSKASFIKSQDLQLKELTSGQIMNQNFFPLSQQKKIDRSSRKSILSQNNINLGEKNSVDIRAGIFQVRNSEIKKKKNKQFYQNIEKKFESLIGKFDCYKELNNQYININKVIDDDGLKREPENKKILDDLNEIFSLQTLNKTNDNKSEGRKQSDNNYLGVSTISSDKRKDIYPKRNKRQNIFQHKFINKKNDI